jgi:tetratricopeptide (TPR) repeat protein
LLCARGSAPTRLGDLRYTQQQLPAAKALYRQALQLRELCCGPLTRGAATPEQQLDLAASLIKLADVSQGLGQGEEAGQCLRRAHGVCCEVQALSAAGAAPGAAGAAAPGAAGEAASAASDAAGGALSAAAVRKLRALLAALQAQGHGVDAGGTTAAAAAD